MIFERRGKPWGRTGAHLVARAASFMLLADSRASFEIEGGVHRETAWSGWGRAILQAGTDPPLRSMKSSAFSAS